MKGGRKLSSWNIFVKKIYQEGHAKNKSYSFKQALSDASKRKSEMGTSSSKATKSLKNKSKRSMSLAGGKTRRRSSASKSRRHH
jgi:hypothetical protein